MHLIYLIGMPACGKSTFGLKLSKALNYRFVDLDLEIEKKENRKITEIFNQNGESYFREIESQLLKDIVISENTIISTGGGAPCFFDNLEFMNAKGITIFIDTPLDILYQRATRSSQRPLLKGKTGTQLFNEIKKKYDHRLNFYSKAQIHIKGSDISENKILTELRDFLNRKSI